VLEVALVQAPDLLGGAEVRDLRHDLGQLEQQRAEEPFEPGEGEEG
jgi:hypothetical protein